MSQGISCCYFCHKKQTKIADPVVHWWALLHLGPHKDGHFNKVGFGLCFEFYTQLT